MLLLEWLQEQPGHNWQERWLASGADAAGERWADGPACWLQRQGKYSRTGLETMTSALIILVGADVVRPSLAWLFTGGKKRKVARNMIWSRDTAGFDRVDRFCRQDPGITDDAREHIVFRLAVIIAAKGGTMADITVGDLLESLDVEYSLRGERRLGSAAFRVLRELGVFGPGVPTLREITSNGQLAVEELVDRYPIACRPVRDLLVDYLKERQPSLDYSTLRGEVYHLAKSFWTDLEQHHPGIASLRLDPATATAWKQRLQTRTKKITAGDGQRIEVTVERLNYHDTLATVRAFYLDLAQWALEDPARWGPWVAPSPVSQHDLDRRKATRRRKARMDARTRERLPILPALVRSIYQHRKEAEMLLAAGRQAQPGQEFNAFGQTLIRTHRPHATPENIWATDPVTGRQRLPNREENHAFWAWAIIEVLRLTGIRIEEMLELSHHSLVQYRLPTTGEIVPLLQIAPSKTDVERLLVVGPELADVLSTIICRIRGADGTVPLIRARDYHELVWMAPAPLLFQHRIGAEPHRIGRERISTLLDQALTRTGLVDADGTPLHCTPHDFRRIFITDAIMNGLPPHTAQVTRPDPGAGCQSQVRGCGHEHRRILDRHRNGTHRRRFNLRRPGPSVRIGPGRAARGDLEADDPRIPAVLRSAPRGDLPLGRVGCRLSDRWRLLRRRLHGLPRRAHRPGPRVVRPGRYCTRCSRPASGRHRCGGRRERRGAVQRDGQLRGFPRLRAHQRRRGRLHFLRRLRRVLRTPSGPRAS